jgi:NitT/TauT family transport system ATP-binding protein
MGRLTVTGVSHAYAALDGSAGTKVLDNVGFDVRDREFVCLLGPSGCGKTTLLKIAAGLEPLTSGEIALNGVPIIGPDPKRGMVFQQYSLFPWRTILDNITFGLEMRNRGQDRASLLEKANRYLELVGLEQFKDSYPHALSGGMQQRAAIARALANEPEVLLMDEPFAALDAQTRNTMQVELLKIRNQKNITVLFVTHSVDEAVFLADTIIVMTDRPGRVSQVFPVDLTRPRNRTGREENRIRDEILKLLHKNVEHSNRRCDREFRTHET